MIPEGQGLRRVRVVLQVLRQICGVQIKGCLRFEEGLHARGRQALGVERGGECGLHLLENLQHVVVRLLVGRRSRCAGRHTHALRLNQRLPLGFGEAHQVRRLGDTRQGGYRRSETRVVVAERGNLKDELQLRRAPAQHRIGSHLFPERRGILAVFTIQSGEDAELVRLEQAAQ